VKRWWVKLRLGLGVILLVLLAWLLASSIYPKNGVERYKDQLRASGEKLTIDELVPPRVPPEKNGAELFNQASPYSKFHGGVIDTNRPPAKQMVGPGKAMIGWAQPGIMSADHGKIVTNSWKDIEADLKYRAPGVEMLQKAVTYPELDFGLNYYDLGHYLDYTIGMRQAARLLSAASSFKLHRGDTPSAATNLHTSLALVNVWKNEPLVVSQAQRLAMASIACDAQWELLQATNLTDSELATLQRDWEEMEFVRPMEDALKMTRVLRLQEIQQFRSSNSPSMSLRSIFGSNTSSSSNMIKDLADAGRHKTWDVLWRVSWSYEDELHDLQGYQVLIDTVRQIETNGFFEGALLEKNRKLKALQLSGTNWLRDSLNNYFMDVFGNAPESLGRVTDVMLAREAARRLAMTAITLKRYQLRHGAWPADLKALVPEVLSEVPKDPVDGQPLRYRPNADGTFLLYSIGSDGKDDGGDPTITDSSYNWLHAGDWVWPQPATPKEVQDYYDHLPK